MNPLHPYRGRLPHAIEALLTDVAEYGRAGEPFGPTYLGLQLWVRFHRAATTN